MIKNYATSDSAFQQMYDYIMESGDEKNGTKYMRNISFTIHNPGEKKIKTAWRKWSKEYAELEWNWYLSGNRSPEMVEKTAKIWADMKDDSGYVNSNYGNWWERNQQYLKAIDLLAADENSRRSVVVHYNPDEVEQYAKDTPCNLVLNFYIEEGKINVTVFARSIDLVYGFCNDQYCFAKLLEDAAYRLNRQVGAMHFFITDLHVYKKHWKMKENFYNEKQLSLFKTTENGKH